jgi:CAAX prenyl protease-like protein
VIWLALEPLSASTRTDASLGTDLARLPSRWAAIWLAFRVIGSVVTVPLAEELAFRGYLTRRLIASDFESVPLGRYTWTSCLVSSILFGAVHGRWFAGTIAGLVFAHALSRRGELTDAVLAHATTNALLAAYVLTTETWSLWT